MTLTMDDFILRLVEVFVAIVLMAAAAAARKEGQTNSNNRQMIS